MVSFFRIKKRFVFFSLSLFLLGKFFSIFNEVAAVEIELDPEQKEQEKVLKYGVGTFDKMGDDIRISRFYRRGPYLIYDCKGKHFACVIKENFENCAERRKKAKIWNKSGLACVPLKKFENRLNCEKTHREKLPQRSPEPLCKN